MSKSLKLTLDILIGAAIPILVLKYGTEPLGALNAYLTAAMIPVVWVLLDLLVITRRFNFITAFVGLTSLMRGALAFWYVDGLLFAVKDSVSYVVSFLVFGVTALLGSPVTRAIALQGLSPDTKERERQMNRLLAEPTVGSSSRRFICCSRSRVSGLSPCSAIARVTGDPSSAVAPNTKNDTT